MEVTKSCKKLQKYSCEKCEYITHNKRNYDKHLLTRKHKQVTCKKKSCNTITEQFSCICGKAYMQSQGLSRHKKTCEHLTNVQKEENPMQGEMMMKMMSQSQEFMIELMKNNKELMSLVGNNSSITNTNSHVNSHNRNKFNLNFFLNETCKDAMNIKDFMDSIVVKLSDLENVGEKGFVEGIAQIIVRELKQLDFTKRPVHCSDEKRESLHVRVEDQWVEENDERTHLKQLINNVQNKNHRAIVDWQKENPSFMDISTKKHEKYMKIVYESMGASSMEEKEQFHKKIIRKISSSAVIQK